MLVDSANLLQYIWPRTMLLADLQVASMLPTAREGSDAQSAVHSVQQVLGRMPH